MCTILLPSGVNQIAFNEYINIKLISILAHAFSHRLDIQDDRKSNTQKNSYDLIFVTYLDMVSAFKTLL